MEDEILLPEITCFDCGVNSKKGELHKLVINSSPIEIYLCTICLEKTNHIVPIEELKLNIMSY